MPTYLIVAWGACAAIAMSSVVFVITVPLVSYQSVRATYCVSSSVSATPTASYHLYDSLLLPLPPLTTIMIPFLQPPLTTSYHRHVYLCVPPLTTSMILFSPKDLPSREA